MTRWTAEEWFCCAARSCSWSRSTSPANSFSCRLSSAKLVLIECAPEPPRECEELKSREDRVYSPLELNELTPLILSKSAKKLDCFPGASLMREDACEKLENTPLLVSSNATASPADLSPLLDGEGSPLPPQRCPPSCSRDVAAPLCSNDPLSCSRDSLDNKPPPPP
mmetsp:Transcript_39539/g.54887  ORF Transcript_39539/g.54887 Transcript_39539/m.54887 type:complete len:167 (-) Transcript_39539:300-800(-)